MDASTLAVMFSSATVEWSTPEEQYAALDAEFGFVIDAACTLENCKALICFTRAEDGLRQEWTANAFCNPPYQDAENPCKKHCKKKRCKKRGYHIAERVPGIGEWVAHGAAQAKKHSVVVVLILPARTDTAWWHDYVWDALAHRPRKGVAVRFARGRWKFGNSENSAPFPTVTVIFFGERM